jgi:hypothetical protein
MTIGIFQVQMLARVLENYYINESQVTLRIVRVWLSGIIWMILTYFTLEMLKVKVKLESASHLESSIKLRRVRLGCLAAILTIVIYEVIISVRTYLQELHPDVLTEYSDLLKVLVAIGTALRLLTDVVLYSLFATLYIYFIRKKKQALSNLGVFYLTRFNLFIILWTAVLVAFNSVYRVMMTIQFAMSIAGTLAGSPFYPVVAWYVFLLFPCTTFLTAVTLNYLFYFQATRKG